MFPNASKAAETGKRYHALVLAGGRGRRMKSTVPKQFLCVRGRPVISHTVEIFLKDANAVSIVVVAPEDPEYHSQTEMIINSDRNDRRKKIEVVPGWRTRHGSVKAGLIRLQKLVKETVSNWEDEIVVIHDGVRPFITHDKISEVVLMARQEKASGTANSTTGTIVELDDEGKYVRNCSRKNHWSSESPQAFQLRMVWESYKKSSEHDMVHMTDCMEIVSKYGLVTPVYVPGDSCNIKLTYGCDMYTITALLKEKEKIGCIFANPQSHLQDILSEVLDTQNILVCQMHDSSVKSVPILLCIFDRLGDISCNIVDDIIQGAKLSIKDRLCQSRSVIFILEDKERERNRFNMFTEFSVIAEHLKVCNITSHLVVTGDIASALGRIKKSIPSIADPDILPSGQILHF